MSLEMLFIWIFTIGVLAGLLFAAFTLIGAAVYDFVNIGREKRLRAQTKYQRYRYRPLLSIIIPVHNENLVIVRCLESILKSSYRNFEVIVSDDKSTDETRDIVRQFIAAHPSKNVYLVAKRKWGGRGGAIDSGLRRAKGELVMALDADCVLDKHALCNMVRHFVKGDTAAVAANIRIMDTGTTISVLQLFDYLISFRSKKFNTVANCEFIIGGAGATYEHSVIKKLKGFDHSMKTEDIEMSLRIARLVGNKNKRLIYASDVIIYTEPVPTFKGLFKQRFRWKFGSLQALYKHRQLVFSMQKHHSKLLTLLRLPFVLWCEFVLLLEPLYFTYFLYLAFVNRNATLFVGANLVMTVLILIAVWSDEHLTLRSRLRLSAYAPIMYLVFFVMTVIQIMAGVKTLGNIKSLIGKKHISGSYISPERIGQQFTGSN